MPCSDNTIRSNSVEAKESHSKSECHLVLWCCTGAAKGAVTEKSVFCFVLFVCF